MIDHEGEMGQPEENKQNPHQDPERVGDVMAQAIEGELDIEFDDRIQYNLQGRTSGGSGGSELPDDGPMNNGQPQKSGIVDHNDVNIIDANDDFEDDE